MRMNELRNALHASPFRPFKIRMVDDREYPVPHRDFLLIHPAGRTAVVATIDEEAYEIIDLPLIASLHYSNGNGRKPSRRRRAG